MNKKILILSDAFCAPLYAPRVRNLAKNLVKKGHFVQVFAEGLPQFPFATADFDLKLYFFYKNRGLGEKFRWLFDQLFFTKERGFQRFIEKNCNVADFDVILCSSFNLFPLPTAKRLAKKYQKPLVADLRDISEQWGESATYISNKSKIFNANFVRKIYEKRSIRLRNKVLRFARSVTTISPWHANFLSHINSATSLVYNGFDEEIFLPKNIKSDHFSILYTGKLYDSALRNPELLFAALQKMQNPQIFVDWYTNIDGQKLVQNLAKKYGVEAQMCFHDYVPNSEIPALLQASSVILVLTNKETERGPHGIMTTKFFEALGVEKPVLCVRSDEACLAAAIEQTNAGTAAKTTDEVVDFLAEKFAEWQQNSFTRQNVNLPEKAKFSRQKQAEEFEKLLLELL